MSREVFTTQENDPYYEDDPRVRALEDCAGRSHYDAESSVHGCAPRLTMPSDKPIPRKRQVRAPFADGESEVNNPPPPYTPVSPEERAQAAEHSHRNLERVSQMLAATTLDNIKNNQNFTEQQKADKAREFAIRQRIRQEKAARSKR